MPGKKTDLCNYSEYAMTPVELAVSAAAAMIAVAAAAYIFYRSAALSAALSPLGLIYLPYRKRLQITRRKDALKNQFKDLLYSLSSGMMAGKSIETALREARADLEIIYPDQETLIIREVDVMLRRIRLNETIDEAFGDLAARSGIDDIESFCGVLSTCRRMGGNLVEIVKNTTNILGDKMEIRNEIDVLLAQRRFEKKILNAMPLVLITALSATSKDYMAPVFGTLTGRLIMTAAIALIALSWLISEKITRINV